MKYTFHLDIGFVNAEHVEEFDIPDEELAGKSEARIEEIIEEYAQDWANNYIDIWWEKTAEETDENK